MRTLIATCAIGAAAMAAPAAAQTVYVNQGSDWTPSLRQQFYTQDQGARIMPLGWMRALTLPGGEAFLHDALARYGYLPMTGRQEADLPAGFTTNGSGADMAAGMTCSACHTRQIEVSGTAYRIDGGPGIVDFQSFLKDLDDAVLAVLAEDAAFDAFADKVLGSGASVSERNALKEEVEVWSNRFHTLISRSLPDPAWGPARLDAVSMIFNRLAGLDLGDPADDHLIPENIAVADAPTRYPFLWNAARQDFTQRQRSAGAVAQPGRGLWRLCRIPSAAAVRGAVQPGLHLAELGQLGRAEGAGGMDLGHRRAAVAMGAGP
ncbi:hypothetical protein K3552_15175 [Leisingera aquaemixtae]|nr:hypothetical protein K3552_15175 [Leisingera aquaemixtae]